MACRVLAPTFLTLEGKVLAPGQPGKSLSIVSQYKWKGKKKKKEIAHFQIFFYKKISCQSLKI